MTSTHPSIPPATRRRIARSLVALALASFAAALGCAPKAAPPAPSPSAPAPAAPVILQTCPGPADGPSILVNALEDAHRALVANPATPLPPACVLSALSQIRGPMPDSIGDHALAIAAELERRGTTQADLLASEVTLLSRARRYADASRAYARLVAIDPQPPMDIARLAAAAAWQRADTSALLRILSTASRRAEAPPPLRTEYTVLRQVGALRSAINEARGFVRQNSRYTAAYPSLVGNFGTLGLTDSVVAYLRRALAQGTSRASLSPALDPYVNTMLRHATLYGSTYGWDAPIAGAMRVDSALSTPSTKFLVASLMVQSVVPAIDEIGALVTPPSWLPRTIGAADASDAARTRSAGCRRIARVSASVDAADARLRAGGSGFAVPAVQRLVSALSNERSRLEALGDVCARGSR